MRSHYLLKLIALALFGMMASLVQAQTDTWLGGTGMWSQMANWSLDAVPGPGNDCVIPANSAPNLDVNGMCHNLTIATSVWPVPNSLLIVFGPSIVNPGSLSFGPSFKGGLSIGGTTGVTAALTGGGTITLLGPNNEIEGNVGGTFMNVDNIISGQGFIGVGDIGIINQSTITATGGTLTIFPSSVGAINTGILQATSGGTLNLTSSGSQSTIFNNTGGLIQALAGSTISLTGGTISGGTITSGGSGIFSTPAGGVNPAWSNLTSNATYLIVQGGSSTLDGTITNNGTIQAQGVLFINGNVTLTGTGSVAVTSTGSINSLNGSGALTNQSTITGAGAIGDNGLTVNNQSTINATDTTAALVLGGLPLNNTKTLQASGGGTLQIGNTVNNSGGTIEAQNGSIVLLDFGTINGGTMTTSGTGTFQSISGILDGTVNSPTNTGLFTVANGNFLAMKSTIKNTGTFALDTTGGCLALEASVTLSGTGKVTMAGPTSCLLSFSTSYTLTNQNTISGEGTIGSDPMPIVNSGTIQANVSGGTLTVQPDTVAGFTNHGTLSVLAGSTLNISGIFTNFSNSTLKGGIYSVMGTFEFLNASIKSNSSNITLTGTAAKIADTLTGNNALKNFSTNAATGIFSLQMGAAVGTTSKFTNKGKLTVGAASAFSLGSSYTQSSGTTTVDGTLTAPTALTVSGGSLVGQGTVAAAITQSGGSITVGDSTTKAGLLTVTGSYSQSTTAGNLNVAIGGNTVGTQYSQLAVSNGIALDGVLNIKLINSFVPTVGSTFTILKGTAVTGTSSTMNGTSINSSEHFQMNYNSNDVTLSVVPGP